MLTSMSRMLVDGAILFSLSSSGSTLPSQEVTSDRSELSFCHCSRSCLMSAAFLCACSSSQRSITPEETRKRDEYVYKCYLPHTRICSRFLYSTIHPPFMSKTSQVDLPDPRALAASGLFPCSIINKGTFGVWVHVSKFLSCILVCGFSENVFSDLPSGPPAWSLLLHVSNRVRPLAPAVISVCVPVLVCLLAVLLVRPASSSSSSSFSMSLTLFTLSMLPLHSDISFAWTHRYTHNQFEALHWFKKKEKRKHSAFLCLCVLFLEIWKMIKSLQKSIIVYHFYCV